MVTPLQDRVASPREASTYNETQRSVTNSYNQKKKNNNKNFYLDLSKSHLDDAKNKD